MNMNIGVAPTQSRILAAENLLKPQIIPRITARVLIEYQNQYLFLVQREERGGELSLPGGRVKNKEFIRKGLVREVLEETNLVITKKDLLPIHTMHRKEDGEFEVIFYFKVSVEDISSLAVTEPEKFVGFEWHPTNEIPEQLIKEFKHVLKSIQKNKLFSEYPKKAKIEKA